jgi:hypothetical protein
MMHTHHSLALLHVNLVTNDHLPESEKSPSARCPADTYKWEALRVHWTSLHQELVPPAIQCIEALRVVDIVDEHAAVGAAVEGNA